MCKDPFDGKFWVTCDACEDVVHSHCALEEYFDEEGKYYCKTCQKQMKDKDYFV